jgi:hypothetical protein
MAVKVSRVVPFGSGTRSFRLVNVNDYARDEKQYQEGLALERERFQSGSISQQVFDRLSSIHPLQGSNTGGPADNANQQVNPVEDDAA